MFYTLKLYIFLLIFSSYFLINFLIGKNHLTIFNKNYLKRLLNGLKGSSIFLSFSCSKSSKL